jgi:hypothetical protein
MFRSSVSDHGFNPGIASNVQLLGNPIAAITCGVRNNQQLYEIPCIASEAGMKQSAVHDATRIFRLPSIPRYLRAIDLCRRSLRFSGTHTCGGFSFQLVCPGG